MEEVALSAFKILCALIAGLITIETLRPILRSILRPHYGVPKYKNPPPPPPKVKTPRDPWNYDTSKWRMSKEGCVGCGADRWYRIVWRENVWPSPSFPKQSLFPCDYCGRTNNELYDWNGKQIAPALPDRA